MVKGIVVLACTLLAGLAGYQEKKPPAAPPAELSIPEEEARRENPLKADAATVAAGRLLYGSQCAMCHGRSGDGKGELAVEIGMKLKDYRDPASLKELSDGALFYILSKGKGEMPAEGTRLSETQRWQLISFIRSLAAKPQRAKTEPL